MEEEIVVDDVDEGNSIEAQQSDDSATRVMPLLYIQQGKIRAGQQTTANQNLVSSNATQLAAIINPVNNPIVTGQNKVFIQGGNQVNSSQSKQHIVIHRPISGVGGGAAPQGQKHILLRKSNASTAQIVPLNASQGNTNHAQPGKHTFAYLGTIIKPNKPRDSVVFPPGDEYFADDTSKACFVNDSTSHKLLPALNKNHNNIVKNKNICITTKHCSTQQLHTMYAMRSDVPLLTYGALTAGQINKPKLVIAPVISQLAAQTSTSTTAGIQSQSPKHMANLLLPVSIPQQNAVPSNKANMFNVKINNGQISADNKGTITVLRESKSSNSSIHPPPLHPITKMSLLAAKSGNNSSDSIKITENPDSAVITPIPKKEESNGQPEKRKKTRSNILRGSGDKRKNQNSGKLVQDNLIDVSYSLSSPESEQDKEKKSRNNDDDITLIKVVASDEKSGKHNASMDDDIKIEIIKTVPSTCGGAIETDIKSEIKSNENTINDVKSSNDIKAIDVKANSREEMKQLTNGVTPSDTNFDAAKVLDWKDGVGTLPGSTLKFCINEFGLMEVVDDDENNKQDKHISIGDKENVCLSQNSSKSSPVTVSVDKKNEEKKASRAVSADTLYRCESCGCYGLAAEFESPISCSPSCTEVIEAKKQHMLRKERDLNRDLRAKRKRKRMLQEQQQPKDQDEKSEDKSQEKIKSETDEDTKDMISVMDEESQSEATESKYPWQTGKLGFSWAKYLEHCKAKAAPVKLFKDAFPYGKNLFRVGMKLEGIDPEHPSHYCVLTVVEIVGYRVRLHFDGYPENYDFWVNADSMDIFPVGWSDKNGHRLDPPKGYVPSNFNWNAYLKICKATAAPKNCFANKSLQTVCPTGFRVGMKLEAVDRKHSSLVCVASIAGLMDSRILVHFDSWDEVYDYWADASSPYIHPVGWCHHNGHSLTPPNNFKDPKAFTWDTYLRETRSVAAPARAFKQRPPCGFKRGMKLEAVDKRIPQLIRVATVEDVKDHMLKIRFDGWPESHAYWVDDDFPDIHPMGWCLKTGHPLEPPLTPENLVERPECGSYGCRGIGHVKGPKFATHNSASGCPYSVQNLQKARLLSDRLNVKHEACDFDEDSSDKQKSEKTERIKMEKPEKPERTEKPEKFVLIEERFIKTEKDVKQEDGELSDKNERSETSERSSKSRHHHSDGQTDDDEISRKRKKRRQASEEPQYSLSNSGYGERSLGSVPYAVNMPDKQLRTELYHSVYNPGYNPLPDAPHIWAKHSNALNRVVAKQHTNPRRWSNEEVIKFIQSVPNCKEIGSIFRKHSIDGEAFLMLTQEDLVSLLGLRLGPAIKLYNSIVLLRRRAA